MTAGAFYKFRGDLETCALKWHPDYDYNMIDVVALPTFVFQPVILVKLLLFWIYWGAFIEGVKSYFAERGWDGFVDYKYYLCFTPVRRNLDECMFDRFNIVIIAPACCFCLFLYGISISWIFGTFFVPIVLFAMFFHYFIYASIWNIHRLCSGKHGDNDRDDKKSEGDELSHRFDCCCRWLKKSIVQLTWWIDCTTTDSEDEKWCTFGAIIGYSYIPLAFSPFICCKCLLVDLPFILERTQEN